MRCMGKKWMCLVAFTIICAIMSTYFTVSAANNLTVNISNTKLTVGSRKKINTNQNDVTFKSSNQSVAYVSEDGFVTAKKKGKAVISVSSNGSVKKLTLHVKAKKKRPSLPVSLDEVELVEQTMEQNPQGGYVYSMKIRNESEKGKIKKIVYFYEIQETGTILVADSDFATNVVETPVGSAAPASFATPVGAGATPDATTQSKEVSIVATNIAAGKTSQRLECVGDYSGSITGMKLKRIELYTGKALYIYDSKKNTYTLDWGTPDKKAPVIKGWLKKKSYNRNEVYRVCFSDQKDTYNFKQYVSVSDNRDTSVKLEADTSSINWKKDGIYRIKYTATDKAGNKTKSWAKIQVYVAGTAESAADSVLKDITKKGWSKVKKVQAIYDYVRNHCAYVDANKHTNWRGVALSGIRYQSGDCYTYYAVARLLITRLGIPNVTVTRYPTAANGQHWWNLVYIKGGWYHFDTTPRLAGGRFCLVTDDQLTSYSTGNTFSFRKGLYPKRAKRHISPTPVRSRSQR